mmetsp:Transcript_22215/g.51771  ORF Transcript_22215/g.51771 Transcript_22215/m.51771 type:complete len:97 (-) Transcript_22215:41-331(-)
MSRLLLSASCAVDQRPVLLGKPSRDVASEGPPSMMKFERRMGWLLERNPNALNRLQPKLRNSKRLLPERVRADASAAVSHLFGGAQTAHAPYYYVC